MGSSLLGFTANRVTSVFSQLIFRFCAAILLLHQHYVSQLIRNVRASGRLLSTRLLTQGYQRAKLVPKLKGGGGGGVHHDLSIPTMWLFPDSYLMYAP